jgi:hypothetical protein
MLIIPSWDSSCGKSCKADSDAVIEAGRFASWPKSRLIWVLMSWYLPGDMINKILGRSILYS